MAVFHQVRFNFKIEEKFNSHIFYPNQSLNLSKQAAGRKSQATDGDKNLRQSRRSVRRSRADGSAEGGRSSTAERKGSILRRRKTSTGRRLGSTVRMGGAGAADVS